MNFVALDVETSNPDLASICQIGIVTFSNGVIIDKWQSLVNPEDYFDSMNVYVHGITEEKVADAPKFQQIYSDLKRLIENKVTVIHTSFDKIAISRAAEKYNLPSIDCTWLDSARVVRRAWEDFRSSGYGLSNVAKEFNIKFEHHNAVEDARAAGEILLRAIDHTGKNLDEWIVQANQPISTSAKSSVTREGKPDGALAGEVIVFTGALNIPRSQAAELAANAGCDVADGVNKKTTLLVVGDQDIRKLSGHEKSSKHRKAEDLIVKGQNIRILGESDFFRLVGEVMPSPFEGFSFVNFWEKSEYADKEYVGSNITPQMIESVERELGYKLPESYIALLQTQNGGIPNNTNYPTTEPTSWADDHVALTGIMGIDSNKPYSLCGELGSEFMKEEWEYPDIGVYICHCPSGGHDMIALDYRKCGRNGEPEVVHVDGEDDYKITFLADNFETFIRGLLNLEKAQMKVRVCPDCGKHNPEDAWQCIDCGETLSINSITEVDRLPELSSTVTPHRDSSEKMNTMSFKYFENPNAFAYMAESGKSCHFCKATNNCLDGANLFGQEEIDAICFSCMKDGRLIDLDIFANEIDGSALDPTLVDIDQVSNEITYCTPKLPTWQDSFWPIKNGRPYKFIKIASKVDYESKDQFSKSLFENSNDPEWLWDMLPDHPIENIKEGQYDLSCYLFELEGDKLTTWDAN